MKKYFLKDYDSAVAYCQINNLRWEQSGANCACGESSALEVLEENPEDNYLLVICESCFKHAANIEKIDMSMKVQNMMTNDVVTIWPSLDHPDSSYGLAVWVDKNNNSYGQCNLWPVPFGYSYKPVKK